MYDALPVTRSLNGYLQDAGPFKHVKHIRSPPPHPPFQSSGSVFSQTATVTIMQVTSKCKLHIMHVMIIMLDCTVIETNCLRIKI